VDVANLLRDLGVDYKTPGQSPHVSHGWVGLVCPWCGRGTRNYKKLQDLPLAILNTITRDTP
jgi:hypothetical protein